jgi:hypothetical protein
MEAGTEETLSTECAKYWCMELIHWQANKIYFFL